MDLGIVIIIIVSIIGGVALFYLHQNKKMNKVEENFRQVPEIREDKVDWSITQHLGWLFKNGDNKNFDNMNLYFNQSNASFFALPLNNNEKINLNVEMVKNGDKIVVNNENYVVTFSIHRS